MGPGYLAFLVAFLSAFLAFFAMQISFSHSDVCFPGTDKPARCPLTLVYGWQPQVSRKFRAENQKWQPVARKDSTGRHRALFGDCAPLATTTGLALAGPSDSG
jgi:hypothetical protein